MYICIYIYKHLGTPPIPPPNDFATGASAASSCCGRMDRSASAAKGRKGSARGSKRSGGSGFSIEGLSAMGLTNHSDGWKTI